MRTKLNSGGDGHDCKEFDLLGAVIKKAIDDYANVHNSLSKLERYQLSGNKGRFQTSYVNELVRNYYSAKNYLFDESMLESFIHRCGLSGTISIIAIRNHASKLANESGVISSLNCIKKYLR